MRVVGNQDMYTAVLQALVVELLGWRASGSAMSPAARCSSTRKDFNLVRECVLSSGLDPQTPGIDMQRACGTGLDAAISDRR